MKRVNKLYMIATPIGNLEDLTARAKRLMQEVDVFFAEDSREFMKLLNSLGISVQGKKIQSYASHNMKEANHKLLQFLEEGQEVGFVSDRGTPAISDPGALAAQTARENGFSVIPVPGVSSVAALFSVSGLIDGKFSFYGFLPASDKETHALFAEVKTKNIPAIFFESPKRIRKLISTLKEHFPHSNVFVGREMTKIHEEYGWHSLSDCDPETFQDRGEYVVLLSPKETVQEQNALEKKIAERLLTDKEWSKRVAEELGLPSAEAYNALQKAKKPTM